MTIQPNSPLQDSGNYFLNAENYESKLMFTDSNPRLNYAILRYDNNDSASAWKIISTGVLNGYLNNADYNYRIDLERFIKIEQYRTLNLKKQIQTIEEIQYQDVPNYVSKVSLILSTGDILTDNADIVFFKSNGEIWLFGDHIPSDMVCNYKFNYRFFDKVDSNLISYFTSQHIYADTWIPFTFYDFHPLTITIKNKYGDVLVNGSLTADSIEIPRIFMVYLQKDASTLTINNDNKLITYNIEKRCVDSYYFYNINGSLDVLYVEGNTHEVNNVNKEYITIGTQKFPTSISYNKQLKVNTGFSLSQDQIYSLIKTPFLFSLYDGILGAENRNYILNSSYITATNNGTTLTIVPTVYLVNGKSYIFSVGSSIVNSGNVTNYTVEVTDDGNNIAYTTTLPISSSVQHFNFDTPSTGNYSIVIYPGIKGSTSGNSVIFNKVKLEFEVENVIIYEAKIGKLFRNEKNGVPTEWVAAIEDTGAEIPKTKRWLLDTNTFEGYNGSKLSEKNIQLQLSDEKTYRRKTNFNLTFWD
jgi:hypothetical protein